MQHKDLTEKQVAEIFAERFPHRTLSSVMNRKSIIGAGRFSHQKRRNWTEADFEVMRANPDMTDADLAKMMGVRLGSLSSARKKADIRKVYYCVKCGEVISQQGIYCKEHRYFSKRWAQYRNKSQKRGMGFDLPLETFHSLIDGACHYCGDAGGGIDRIDSDKGYVVGNTVSCCWTCNAMKNNHPTEVWIAHMRKIIERFGVAP